MGVDFRIDNDQRFIVTGTITDYWQGERTLDGAMDNWEVRGLFEDPPEAADIRVRTEPLEPPLPDAVASMHVGMPYSSFRRLRDKLAATLDIDLDMMWGYMPTSIRIAEMRGLSRQAAAMAPDFKEWEEEQEAWWREHARQWDTVDSGLVPFLDHSDCEGDLSPDECRRVAPALAEAIEKMGADNGMAPGHSDRDRAKGLLEMIEAAAKYERRFLFR